MEIAALTALSTLLLVAVLIDHGLRNHPNPRPIYALARRPRAKQPRHREHPRCRN